MGRKDLGTCVIMSKKDVERLGIKLDKLEKIDNFRTPIGSANSFFNPHRKLMRYVEKSAKRERADLAVITREYHEFGFKTEIVHYEYSLYRYK
jgi:hypothetical protein